MIMNRPKEHFIRNENKIYKMNNKLPAAFCLLLLTGAACTHRSKLETDKEKLTQLKKQEGDIMSQIQALNDTIKAEGGNTVKTTRVGEQTLALQPFRHFVEVQAAVYGQDNIEVSSETMGVIKRILVTEGDQVRKGQVLAQLDDSVLLQNIQEMQSALNLAATLYEKQKALWDQKIGTEVQYLSAKTNYESQQNRLSALQQQDEMMKLKSPIDGVVDAVNIKIGESVAPGLPTVRVVNLEHLKVKGDVAEAYIADIHKGDSLKISFPDLHTEVTSTVSYISRSIDEVNRTFTVEVDLPQNPDYHPNMIAIMKIMDYYNPAAIVIPVNIVQNDPTGAFVYTAVDHNGIMTATKAPVTIKTGMVYDGMAEISAGLKAGDKLVTVGYEDLNNGDAISF